MFIFKKISIVFLIVCLGCNQEQQVLTTREFFPTHDSVIVKLSDIATDVEYVPLRKSNDLWLDIQSSGDKYYIRNLSDEIGCFDQNGMLLNKLSKKGKAPDEYELIHNYNVNSEGNLIAISSNKALKLYYISDTGFNFCNSIKIENLFVFSFFPGTNNLLLLFYDLEPVPFTAILINPKGDTLAVKRNYNKSKTKLEPVIFFEPKHYIFKDKLFFKESFNDTIFSINPSNEISTNFIIDSRNQLLTREDAVKLQSQRNKRRTSKKTIFDFYNIRKIWEASRYQGFHILFGQTISVIIFDKKLESYYTIANNSSYLQDDIIGGLNFMPHSSYGDRLFMLIDAEDLITHVNSENFRDSKVLYPEKKESLKLLADSIKNTNCRVLAILTMKN